MASKEESGPKADDDSGSKLSKHDAIAKKPPPAPPPAVKAGEKAEFYIAKGKAITSRRGILAEGDSCQPADFLDGESTLNELVRKGYVVKSSGPSASPS